MDSKILRPKHRASPVSDDLRLASYPPPYPDGWYRLMSSKSLRRGQVRYLECLGRALVVWRSEDADDVHAMRAFCPHLGANLGHGRVRKDRIECPFHAWQFSGDGRVACIPYSDNVPSRIVTESFPVEEVYGQIFLYHRGGGIRQQASDEVPYPVPRVREVDDGSFTFRGHHDGGRVRMHIIEIVENAADFAHFASTHGRMIIPWTQIPIPGVELEYTSSLEFDDDRPWTMRAQVRTVPKVFGRRLERAKGNGVVTYSGAGSILNFRLTIPGQREVALYQTHLPIAPLEQQVDFHWFANPGIPRLLVWYIVGNWISQWRKDVRIWENKVYAEPPVLCRDDGPVGCARRWYRQFFPDWQPARKPYAASAETDTVDRSRVAWPVSSPDAGGGAKEYDGADSPSVSAGETG